jgi:hypothetical protein
MDGDERLVRCRGMTRLLNGGPNAANLAHDPFEFRVQLQRDNVLAPDLSHRHPQLTEPLGAGRENYVLNLSQLSGGALKSGSLEVRSDFANEAILSSGLANLIPRLAVLKHGRDVRIERITAASWSR